MIQVVDSDIVDMTTVVECSWSRGHRQRCVCRVMNSNPHTPKDPPCIMSRRKQQSALDQVSEFDRGRIVVYRDCGLSLSEKSVVV
ncbi:hypothetical protein TNCV_1866821 [Trichonephila clavipes]|nr:hypothetical protein TNCV_1866821 [Trichonephila clavipes]